MFSPRRLCLALTLLASCQQVPERSPDTAVGEPPSGTVAGEPAPGTSVSEPTPTESTGQLTPEGWGGLRIGMTRAEVVATLGEDANPAAVGGPDPERCDEFRPERAPAGLRVMILDGHLARITLSDPATVATEGGITVGDQASAVRSHFAGRAESTAHYYQDPPAEYLTVWTAGGPNQSGSTGIVYEVGADGRVMHIHAGGPSIQYVEGCL